MELTIQDFKAFPTTRYQGSKRKMVGWIYQNLKHIEFDRVLDAFGGTGSVSYLFKRMGKSVNYNDSLRFNHIVGKAIIENDKVQLTERDIEYLLRQTKINSYDFIRTTFKGIYYTTRENRWLDNFIGGLDRMNTYPDEILNYKKALAQYALYQACLTKRPFNLFHRNNLHIRTNDVERNFGNKTTWERTFGSQFTVFAKEANRSIINTGERCRSTNESVFDIEDVDYDLVYLDPPYVANKDKNETSNYLKCYHFLEGISNYHDWESAVDFETRNLRFREPDSQYPFHPKEISTSIEKILHKFQDSIIVLSYKRGGVPSVESLTKLMKKFKKNVFTRSLHYQYALNRQNGDARKNREVLIIGI